MSKHNKNQKNISFNQLMRNVDESLKTTDNTITPEEETVAPVETVNTDEQTSSHPHDTMVPEGYTVQKDADGDTVAKSANESASKSFASLVHTSAPEVVGDNPEVEIISKKIEAYLKCNTGVILNDPEKQKKAGELFRDILFYATDHPVKPVLDVVYRFFRQNRDRVLAPQVALPPTLNFQRDVTERISCVYTLFRGLAEDKPFKLNMATTRVLLHLNDNRKVDALLTYFESKQK